MGPAARLLQLGKQAPSSHFDYPPEPFFRAKQVPNKSHTVVQNHTRRGPSSKFALFVFHPEGKWDFFFRLQKAMKAGPMKPFHFLITQTDFLGAPCLIWFCIFTDLLTMSMGLNILTQTHSKKEGFQIGLDPTIPTCPLDLKMVHENESDCPRKSCENRGSKYFMVLQLFLLKVFSINFILNFLLKRTIIATFFLGLVCASFSCSIWCWCSSYFLFLIL